MPSQRYPASRSQQAVWFSSRLFPDSAVYNLLWQIKIAGTLDVPTLLRCVQLIVERHESLRTSFAMEDEDLVQVVASRLTFECSFVDLSDLPAEKKTAQFDALSREFGMAPFDLEKGPLIRFRLVRIGENDHRLLASFHHMVTDGTSWPLFVDELTACYAGQALAPLPAQYGQYAAWQREMLQGETWRDHELYWREVLGGQLPVVDLPGDRPRPQVRALRGAVYEQTLSLELTAALKGVKEKHNSTLFKLLLAAFNVLLHRLTGETDLIVSTTLTGRVPPEMARGIGFFVNRAALRTSINGDPSFVAILNQVQSRLDEAVRHEGYPYDEVLRCVSPLRSMNREPITTVNFTKLPPPVERRIETLVVSEDRLFLDTENLDLSVYTQDTVHGIRLICVYNSDLFERTTIGRMLTHFQTLLKGIAADPYSSISQLPLITESERHQLLVQWNDTKRDYPADKCVHELFEEQVERTPDAVAAIFQGRELTYRELNQRANQLAHHLLRLGAGPEQLIGILMERSLEMVVAVLAILKTGGAYVPLDHDSPEDRLVFFLQDTKISILVTQQPLKERRSFGAAHVLCLDPTWETVIRNEPNENPISRETPAGLAYVTYTSGSTGQPKGVMIEHRSLVNYLYWVNGSLLNDETRALPMTTELTFDACLKQLFAPLLGGKQIRLIPRDAVIQPAALLQEIRKDVRVGLNCVPSLWAAILDEIDSEQSAVLAGSLNSLFLGGERLNEELVTKSFTALPALDMWNLYGPTEATANASSDKTISSSSTSIGTPINNTQIYLLDKHLQPVPIGVIGEIYIGGAGLARGYLNRPDLTAEKFIANPFGAVPGARMYRTGDLARYLPDGRIDFVGRIDDQVKVRGFRIELREIELTLDQHPLVQQSVVLAREDSRDTRLVAYIVPNQRPAPVIQDLRNFLKQKLPEYMVPAAFVVIDALPLTHNGKVDRRALPAPEANQSDPGRNFVAPRTLVEEVVANIWAHVLDLKEVSIFDNFFELGGHSLVAVRIISRLRDAFRVEVPLGTLFETPTVYGVAESIERGLHVGQQEPPPFQAVARTMKRPLSFAQQRLWLLDQLQPGSPTYNIAHAFRIGGALNIEALHRALATIVARHESLRTVFASTDKEPVQVTGDGVALPLPVLDLGEIPRLEREAKVRQLINEEARRSFNLADGPLIRVVLLRLGEGEHILQLTMHHIVSDGWSMSVLFRELSTLYEVFSHGQPSPLGGLPIQYVDYAVWQRDWLQGPFLEQRLTYWKRRLAAAPAALDLPTDRPRPPIQTFRGARHSVTLSRDLLKALRALSLSQGATLFMTLLAAFKVLLSRYARQADIVVGVPVAGRSHAVTENLIGFFANTLVLRSDLSGDPTFKILLKRIKDVALEAYAHQELPFEKLVEVVQPERDLSYNPLFQVLFALHNTPTPVLNLSGLSLSPVEADNGAARFDLALDLRERPDGLIGSIEYSTDLFDRATIIRMAGHYQTLLESIACDPDQPISTLALLTDAEQQQLLVEWSGSRLNDDATDPCLHELFEAQVSQTPNVVALVCDGKNLTYKELNSRANQLAHYLKSLGAGPEVPVAICVERSVEMVVGLLAILKAGGAYVPLDPDYPKERLAFMLEDIQTPLLLTQQRVLRELNDYRKSKLLADSNESRSSDLASEITVVCLDSDWETIAGQSEENLSLPMTAENLAYVIYTSGSTGRPKGVQICHRNVVRLLDGTRPLFSFDEHDIWTVFHSYAFDFSVWEIWGSLLQGGRLIIVPRHVVQSPAAFRNLLRSERVTVLNQTPSAARQLVEEQSEGRRRDEESSLRVIISGGEAFPPDLAAPLMKLGAAVWNFYGPTEATVWTAINRVQTAGFDSEFVPIGRPITDRRICLLDHHLQPVPIGVPGELHIGGPGLARGYFKRPELTAEMFIPDPYGDEPGARLYTTGDLARYRADGNIEFLGRMDNQVKIRGFRIELQEIEAVLKEHPAISDAVVLARADTSRDVSVSAAIKQLVAYIVPERQGHYTASELFNFLRAKLPDYMIPSRIHALDCLPLTPNGKVDLRALPAPDETRPNLGTTFVAPRTPTENLIADIWVNVLRLEHVGIYDHFFELGGHSLLATQVISRLRTALRVEIPLLSIFQTPTVAGLAEHIEMTSSRAQISPNPSIRPITREREMPLSFAQERLWFLHQLDPTSTAYHIRGAFRIKGPLAVEALKRSIEELVRRHESLRTTFNDIHGSPVQIIAPPESFTLEVSDLSARSGSERETEAKELARAQAELPFDLLEGPLLRAALLILDKQDHVLLLTLHHIVCDDWSMGVLYRELSILYEAFSSNQRSPLADLPLQYVDFAVWQRGWLHGDVMAAQLSYWKKQLEGAAPAINFPADRSRPARQTFRGAKQSIRLSEELTNVLKELSSSEGVTLFMTLLAAFQTLLHRYTAQDDIAVGSPIAGRNRDEIEGLVGFFINTLVLRCDLSGNPTFRELLVRVRDIAVEAYAHQDLPFEKLVEELQPERDLSRTPLFQVFFNMLQENSTFALPGLSIEPFANFVAESKFDLTLYVISQDREILLDLVYNADLFEPDTIKQILGQYRALLKNIGSNPQRPISAYELLSDAERRHLASRTNSVRSNQPFMVFQQEEIEQSIASRFESQVDRYPDKTAIKTKTHQWSYGKLNHNANQIAATIVKLSSGREQRIGLLFEHDEPMIAAILGTLKSGATYIPLETFHPANRISYMLQDSQATAIITDSGSMPLARSLSSGKLPVINVDEIDGSNTLAPASPISPDTLAYILYTSGSTGTPKGVMQNHRNVLRHIRNYTNSLHINADDRLTLFSSCGFDAAIMDIFGALLNGATLHPMGLREEGISSAVVDRLISQNITVYHSTPSVFRHLFHTSPGGTDLSSVRTVVLGGEQTLKSDVDLFNRCFSEHTILVNGLGPTECTLALQYFIQHDDRAVNELVPVGYPVENTEVLLLDQAGEPTDVYGEIGIKSPGLALGYWGREELTNIAFIPDPTGGTGRTYRTGDMGRLLPDGSIGFVGRKDAQVKIRGFRVEPGEVEFVLGKHPAVRETAVVTREDASGTSALVAYVVPKQGVVFFATEARSFLKKQLPDYMVPSAFVLLELFPLTANGKVDRRALPAPDSTRPELEQPFVAPRNQVEEVLANIWAEILALDKVGVCDNFFDLGGHSLLASRLVSRIQRELNLPVSLRAIFENPTIESLAIRLLRQSGASTADEIDELLSELESISDGSAERQLSKT